MADTAHGSALFRALSWWHNQGLDDLTPGDRRSARLLNLAATISAIYAAAFGIGYSSYDHAGLWPAVAACAALSAGCAVSPAVIGRRFVLGVLWLTGLMICSFTFIAYALGAESWVHTTLSSAFIAGVFLAVGLTRFALAATIAATGLAASLFAEVFFVGPAPGVRVDPGMLLVVKINMMLANGFVIAGLAYLAIRRVTMAEKALAAEHARSEALLDNLLPEKIATRLKNEPDQIIADNIGQATILFADIVDFTPRAASMPPEDLIRFLNKVFTAFDEETDRRGLEKIKTIGDAYMVAAGMPDPRPDHAAAIADLALRMIEITERLSAEAGAPISVRIGVHTGPAVAGVIGVRKFFYDVWGDTVNTASRMESHSDPDRIQITAETKMALGDAYLYEPRGFVDIKGKGPTETWWLTGRR